MSTCAGAPAPHENCPHGDACDWTPEPDFVLELPERLEPDTLAELRSMAVEGISLRERGRAWLRARQTRTPARAIATIEKLETEDVDEIGVPVYVWPANRGRVTGHGVGCEEHGVMPFLAPTKGKAILAAARHIRAEHQSAGSVVLVPTAPRLRIRSAS